jgi:hypothetical protein
VIKIYTNIIVVFLGIVLACSCNAKHNLNPEKLVAFINNPKNGYTIEREVGEFVFEAKWRPLVYEQALQKLNNVANLSQANITEADDTYFISLKVKHQSGESITKWNAADMNAIQQNIYYLSFGLQQGIQLIDGTDTLECIHYDFERSYDLADYSNINLMFQPIKWSNQSKTLVIDGNYFSVPPIKIKFKEEHLKQQPNLKI